MASEAADIANETEAKPKDPVASIAGQVTVLSTGDRAALRRIYLTRSHEADGVVQGLLHRAGVQLPSEMSAYLVAFRPWRLLAHVVALLSGTAGAPAHKPGRPFGRALHDTGYSENRFLRLTAARGEQLHGQIVRAARTLAQAGTGPVDLWPLLQLAGTDTHAAETARLRIARDYYSAQARSEGDAK